MAPLDIIASTNGEMRELLTTTAAQETVSKVVEWSVSS